MMVTTDTPQENLKSMSQAESVASQRFSEENELNGLEIRG